MQLSFMLLTAASKSEGVILKYADARQSQVTHRHILTFLTILADQLMPSSPSLSTAMPFASCIPVSTEARLRIHVNKLQEVLINKSIL